MDQQQTQTNQNQSGQIGNAAPVVPPVVNSAVLNVSQQAQKSIDPSMKNQVKNDQNGKVTPTSPQVIASNPNNAPPQSVQGGGQPVPINQAQQPQIAVAVSPGQQNTTTTPTNLASVQQSQDAQPVSAPVDDSDGFVSGGDKERVEFGPKMAEVAPVVELKEDHEIEPEVESWLEKLEKGETIQLPQPISDDDGNVVMADAGTAVMEDKIVLPVTESEYEKGLHQKVSYSARWLAEWVKKLIKQMGDETVYRQE